MEFYPFEVTIPHILYAALGGFIVLFGMFSLLLRERLYIGEAIWAFLFGVIIGPYCADIFNPREWGGGSEEVTNMITLEFTRVVLAIGVFAIGVELPKAYMARHWKSLFFLLVPVMTWGWFVSAALIYALIPGLNFLSSLAVAACLTPTDPILAAAVVGGKWADKHVPAHIRHLLAAESGCNDGAAFPFLFISLYLIIDNNVGRAIRDWVLLLWLYQVVLGTVIGGLLGFGFRHLMKFCQRRDLIDRQSYVAQYISLAIFAMGITTLLGSDDLLAAFSCGVAFAWDGFFNRQTEEAVFSSVIDTLFNIAAFVFVGAWMPFNKFEDKLLTLEVWRLVVIAILVLLLRRLPIIVALYKWIPDIKTFREAVFSGHFGPIGIGAVFISTLATEVLHESLQDAARNGQETEAGHLTQTELLMQSIQPIVAFMVLCSITIHGLSIPSFSLGRRVHSVSRTWSRRDTMTSIGTRVPEWANQARIVTRREDIIINRDIDQQLQPDLEKGESITDKPPESLVSEETKLAHMTAMLGDEKIVGSRVEEKEVEQEDHYIHQSFPELVEWKEGAHRVIEKKEPGSDVEVTVINRAPSTANVSLARGRWSGKLGDLEKGAGHFGSGVQDCIRKGFGTLGKGTTEVIPLTPAEGKEHGPIDGGHTISDNTPRGQEQTNSAIEDDDEDAWSSEGSDHGIAERGSVKRKPGKQRIDKTVTGHPHHVSAHKPRRRSFRRAHSLTAIEVPGKEEDIVEEQRGRDVRWPSTSRPASTLVSFADGTSQSSGKTGQTTHHPRSRAVRPSTADGHLLRSTARPGAGDSGPRNHRVESIRALYSVPPTRENSPSRSVRFAQIGESSGSSSKKSSVGMADVPGPDSFTVTGFGSARSSPLASAQVSRAPSPIPASPEAVDKMH